MWRNNWLIYFPAAVVLILICSFQVNGQIYIAPTSVFMGDGQQTERFIIRNSSSIPQEINIDLLFGYPEVDESGNVSVKTFGAIPHDAPDASQWIRVYPRHLVLPPHQQQVVRLSARPPIDLPAGEYWARPVLSLLAAPERDPRINSGVTTHIHFIKRMILSLNYRHGRVQTGLNIGEATAVVAGGQIQLWTNLERSGNAAYLGTLQISIYNDAEEVLQHQQEIAVYHSQRRRFTIDAPTLPPGKYTVRLRFDTAPRAAKQPGILPALPAEKIIDLLI